MEINQDSYFLNQLKSQPADPKAKEKIDSEVRDRRDAYHQALLDLRKLVDSATEKYDELAKNDEVKKTLIALGKGQREKPKLGPSHEFLTNVKLLEKLEKAESSGETEPSPAKTGATQAGSGTRTKQSSKAADAAEDSGGLRVSSCSRIIGARWSIRLVRENTAMIRSWVALVILGPALAVACTVTAARADDPQPEDVLKSHGLSVQTRGLDLRPRRRVRQSSSNSTKPSVFSSN